MNKRKKKLKKHEKGKTLENEKGRKLMEIEIGENGKRKENERETEMINKKKKKEMVN